MITVVCFGCKMAPDNPMHVHGGLQPITNFSIRRKNKAYKKKSKKKRKKKKSLLISVGCTLERLAADTLWPQSSTQEFTTLNYTFL